MRLFLDHQQRLNLIVLLGAQKGSLADIRQLWTMQDRLELNDDEKRSINLRTVFQPNAGEATVWDVDKKLAPTGFDFSQAELDRLRKLIEEWPYFSGADRAWAENLLEQFNSIAAAPALSAN
jgi:hypothetical protein